MNWPVVTARWAVISRNKLHRYVLFRGWDCGSGYVTFVLLNPSIADGKTDDPTVRRCISFAALWGYRGFYIVNLYAYRATDPKNMLSAVDPVGPKNSSFLYEYTDRSDLVVAAWGAYGDRNNLGTETIKTYADSKWKCFGVTAKGQPLHPLYLHQMTPLVPLTETIDGHYKTDTYRSVAGRNTTVLRRSKKSAQRSYV